MVASSLWRGTVFTASVGLLISCLCPGPASAQSESEKDLQHVRVRLHHQAVIKSAELSVKQNPLALYLPDSDTPVMRIQPGETVQLGVRQEDVYLHQSGNGLYATELHTEPVRENSTWALSFPNHEDRTYTGHLSVKPDPGASGGLLLVNTVPLQDYVASVVASEYGLDTGEGAKAMAVVARTYALFSATKFGDEFDQADGTASQVYKGVDAATDGTHRAAEATRGEVLTHEGDPIQAVYFSSSGGHTANSEDVWTPDESVPYLRGKEDPYDSESPHHTWSVRIDRSTLLDALSQSRNGQISGFTIESRSDEGRVETIRLIQPGGSSSEMRANTFRLLVNRNANGLPLKSTWFTAHRNGNRYVFEGRGFGHGVGLSQWGAHAMSNQGHDYREILQFYYTDVSLTHLDELDVDPGRPRVATEDAADEDEESETRIGW